jgi:hypothetical protein
MDPVLAGGFTLLGVFVAGAINYLVAWQNRATQVALAEQDRVTKLALAREEARRVRRERQVQAALDNITVRAGTVYMELHEATDEHDMATVEDLERGARRTAHVIQESAWLAAEGFSREHPLALYMAAERRMLQRAKEYSEGVITYSAYDEEYQRVLKAIATIYQAAERYIDDVTDAT